MSVNVHSMINKRSLTARRSQISHPNCNAKTLSTLTATTNKMSHVIHPNSRLIRDEKFIHSENNFQKK
jgi:hypothetical protein